MKRSFHIGVAGGADCTAELYGLAEKVGLEIGKAGATLVCGGRTGVMEAAARGARAGGGHTIGVLPGVNRGEANRFIEHVICTGMGQARNVVLVLSTNVLIAIGGEYGTLSEIALALKHRIPVVGLCSWAVERFNDDPLYAVAHSADTAVRKALAFAEHYAPQEPSGEEHER